MKCLTPLNDSNNEHVPWINTHICSICSKYSLAVWYIKPVLSWMIKAKFWLDCYSKSFHQSSVDALIRSERSITCPPWLTPQPFITIRHFSSNNKTRSCILQLDLTSSEEYLCIFITAKAIQWVKWRDKYDLMRTVLFLHMCPFGLAVLTWFITF